MTFRESITVQISWLPADLTPTGRVGLTHSPGAWQGSRDDDLRSLADADVDRLVCLQEPYELDYSDIEGETIAQRAAAVEDLGMRFTHFPIPDFGTPRVRHAQELVARLQRDLVHGRRVVIHCFAGLGRAGTIAASLLAASGLAPERAIAAVRQSRPGAVQTPEQERFVSLFAARAATES